MKKIEFTSEDIIQRRNCADLFEYGDFRGEYIEFDPEIPDTIYAHGTLFLTPRHTDREAVERKGELEISIAPDFFTPELLERIAQDDITAGELFCSPWENWFSADIPAEWKF